MNDGYSKKIKCILEEGERCKKLMGPCVVQGPTGPTGPAALNAFGSRYDASGDDITLTANVMSVVPLSSLGPLFGITGLTENSLTLTDTGTFKIDYSFSGSSSANATINVEVLRNGNLISSSTITRTVTANANENFVGSVIVALESGDDLSLGIESSAATTITLNDGIAAYLNVVQLS